MVALKSVWTQAASQLVQELVPLRLFLFFGGGGGVFGVGGGRVGESGGKFGKPRGAGPLLRRARWAPGSLRPPGDRRSERLRLASKFLDATVRSGRSMGGVCFFSQFFFPQAKGARRVRGRSCSVLFVYLGLMSVDSMEGYVFVIGFFCFFCLLRFLFCFSGWVAFRLFGFVAFTWVFVAFVAFHFASSAFTDLQPTLNPKPTLNLP